MKISESGFVFHQEAISPEAARAQRQAELKDIAEYRARRLKAYQDWADPVKREATKAKAAMELEQAKVIWEKMVAEDSKKLEMHRPQDSFADRISVQVISKAPGKRRPWWRRILDWFRG